jgi:hypothetical protein
MQTHWLEIAGYPIRVQLPEGWTMPQGRFTPFSASGHGQEAAVNIVGTAEDLSCNQAWQFVREGVVTMWEQSDAGVAFSPKNLEQTSLIPPLELTLDTVLRVVLARHLARRRGLLLHASAWLRHGRAAVFFGATTAGKTTTVGAAPPGEYLCDDGIIVRRLQDGWAAFGTPFRGSDGRPGHNGGGNLAAAFAIEKAPTGIRRMPLGRPDALRRLLRCVMLHDHAPQNVAGTLGTASELVDAGLVEGLMLAKGEDPWQVV